jgi:putative endonuclease
VYFLRCRDGSLYAGSTNDLARRLEAHGRGKGARYTRSRLPVVLAWTARAKDRSAALRREAALKRLSRTEKLALVAGRGPRRPGPAP